MLEDAEKSPLVESSLANDVYNILQEFLTIISEAVLFLLKEPI